MTCAFSLIFRKKIIFKIFFQISTGKFPECWKNSKTVPIHKRGNKSDVSNYRPVSCVPTAYKVLEDVIFAQLSEYFETHSLLPQQQHGFRSGQSCRLWGGPFVGKRPNKVFPQQTLPNIQSRAITWRDLISNAKSELSQWNVLHQAVKIWNFEVLQMNSFCDMICTVDWGEYGTAPQG